MQKKTRVACAIAKQERVGVYNINPFLCKECYKPISYDDNIKRKVFCTQSCAAIYNNKNRVKRFKICTHCGIDKVKNYRLQFCSEKCSSDNRHTLL